jgi:hypothetical protein
MAGFQDIENGILDVVMAKFLVPTKNAVLNDLIHWADARGGIYEFSQNMDSVNADMLTFELLQIKDIPAWGQLTYMEPDAAEVQMWDVMNKLRTEVQRDM